MDLLRGGTPVVEKWKSLALRYEDLEAQLADPAVYGDAGRLRDVNRELKELAPIAGAWRDWEAAERRRAGAEELLRDPDFKELAQEELSAAKAELRRQIGRASCRERVFITV